MPWRCVELLFEVSSIGFDNPKGTRVDRLKNKQIRLVLPKVDIDEAIAAGRDAQQPSKAPSPKRTGPMNERYGRWQVRLRCVSGLSNSIAREYKVQAKAAATNVRSCMPRVSPAGREPHFD